MIQASEIGVSEGRLEELLRLLATKQIGPFTDDEVRENREVHELAWLVIDRYARLDPFIRSLRGYRDRHGGGLSAAQRRAGLNRFRAACTDELRAKLAARQ